MYCSAGGANTSRREVQNIKASLPMRLNRSGNQTRARFTQCERVDPQMALISVLDRSTCLMLDARPAETAFWFPRVTGGADESPVLFFFARVETPCVQRLHRSSCATYN